MADGAKRIKVTILGSPYHLKSDKEEFIVQQLAQQVDERMREISRMQPYLGLGRTAVLAALRLANELFELRRENEALREEIEALQRTLQQPQGEGQVAAAVEQNEVVLNQVVQPSSGGVQGVSTVHVDADELSGQNAPSTVVTERTGDRDEQPAAEANGLRTHVIQVPSGWRLQTNIYPPSQTREEQ